MQASYVFERAALTTCLVILTGLSWYYLIGMSADMSMADSAMGMMSVTFLSLFLMWAIMMVAMMLPSAYPMIMVFMSVSQRRKTANRRSVSTWIFISGYVVVWILFSVLASLAQWRLQSTAWFSSDMMFTSTTLSGILLLLAGAYQWSGLKQRCLQLCRSPLNFLMARWQEGPRGAIRMGLEHGLYCLGCCWLLMALLFVAGVMNLLWVALLTGLVILEKLLPRGDLVARISGIMLASAGMLLLTGMYHPGTP